MDTLPRVTTLRTPQRTLELIEEQAEAMILASKSRDGKAWYGLDRLRFRFGVGPVLGSYMLSLHNGFLTETFAGGYNMVSNVSMTEEEFLDFAQKIVQRADNFFKRFNIDAKTELDEDY